jgi:hypothetical protein
VFRLFKQGVVFRQWGDSLFVAIQTLVIVMQILFFRGQKPTAIAVMSAYWMVGMAVSNHFVPLRILEVIQALVIPILFVSKVCTIK